MIEHRFAVAATPEVDIDVRTAEIVLDRGPAGAVTVQVEAKNAGDWSVTQHGDAVIVRDERSGWRTRSGGRVRVTVPDHTAARITTASGDVASTIQGTSCGQVMTSLAEIEAGESVLSRALLPNSS